MKTTAQMNAYVAQHKTRFVEELMGWLRIASVSTDPSFAPQVQEAAVYLCDRLREAGAEAVRSFETPGYPVVYAEKRAARPEAPTVLVYGHYDVQPADPYELWDSPPFEPTERNGRLYARGACDDKGQAYMHVKALEVMQQRGEEQPCHLKFLMEGEEEIGSPNLEAFMRENKALLACDAVLISDTAMVAEDCPSITIGVRGLCYLELHLRGTTRDLHSGEYGGVVDNPVLVLARLLASLKDAQGRVCIPHFYDRVRALSKEERAQFATVPFDESAYRERLGLLQLFGEPGYNYWERVGARPALDANGIWGGYDGEGAKTVLPAAAGAKLSMRLVPDQEPEEIAAQTEAFLRSQLPPTMQLSVRRHHSSPASLLSTDSAAYRAAARALEKNWGHKPLPMRGGGTIPIVGLFDDILERAPVLMGFGLEEDSLHAPNESFRLDHFFRGIGTIIDFYEAFAKPT